MCTLSRLMANIYIYYDHSIHIGYYLRPTSGESRAIKSQWVTYNLHRELR